MTSRNKTQIGSCTVRACNQGDVPAIQGILAESPEAAFWSLQAIDDVLKQSWVSALVSERDGFVTGFIVGKRVSDEGEILNLAVRAKNRRQGDGESLIVRLLQHFLQFNVERVFLEVRRSNASAIRLYERLGFREIGRREGYYREPLEAALVLERKMKFHSAGTE
jgi:ribosomal-protein-alanine acetyltransferase